MNLAIEVQDQIDATKVDIEDSDDETEHDLIREQQKTQVNIYPFLHKIKKQILILILITG